MRENREVRDFFGESRDLVDTVIAFTRETSTVNSEHLAHKETLENIAVKFSGTGVCCNIVVLGVRYGTTGKYFGFEIWFWFWILLFYYFSTTILDDFSFQSYL